MKNKLLATLVITGLTIGTTAALVSADNETTTTTTGSTSKQQRKMPELTAEQKAEFEAIKTILDKKKAGTTLTADEEAKLKTFEANKPQMKDKDGKGGRGGKEGRGERDGNGFGMKMQLTDEEKTKLESMTDTEKKAFFEAKHTEMKAKHEAQENVMDKLINGETLTDSEKVTLAEIKTQRAEIKAKKAEMEAIKTILNKKKAGTTLTADEEAKLKTFEANKPQMKNKADEENTQDAQ